MGLNVQQLNLLLLARSMGARFDRTIMIGRHDILVTPHQIANAWAAFGLPITEQEARQIFVGKDQFAEPIFEKLGAQTVDSVDASAFEEATIVHDFNFPVPAHLHGAFSLVYDGGTLEHVFNFPIAIQNCMNLPAIGGHIVLTLPANNWMGHGFYQFSPDLFYRILSAENGYQIEGLWLVSVFSDNVWLKVKDPAVVSSRVGYNETIDAMSLFVIAKRTNEVPLFARPPQQSDYATEWSKQEKIQPTESRLAFFNEAVEDRRNAKHWLREWVPEPVLRWRRAFLAARHVARRPNPAHFEPFPVPPDH